MSIVEEECEASQTLTDERELYIDSLLCAARDYHDRGWTPIPIIHRGGSPIPPKGWKSWTGRRWRDIERRFLRADALGLSLVGSKLTWLDFDVYDQYQAWLSKASPVLRSLPRYRTKRGVHVIARLKETITSPIKLKDAGVDGELRCGAGFVVVPPSIHRDGETRYRWEAPLFESDDSFPLLDVADLLNNSDATRFALDRIRTRDLDRRRSKKSPSKPSKNRPEMPKHNVLHSGVEAVEKGAIHEAIKMTLPSGKGQRVTKWLPAYVRLLKNKYRGDLSESEVRAFGRSWWCVARAKNLTAAETSQSSEDYVWYLWERFDPSKKGILSDAQSLAKTVLYDHEIDVAAPKARLGNMRELFRLIYCLDLLSPDDTFFLSCRDARDHIEKPGTVDHIPAYRLLLRLVRDGHLICVDNGTPGKRTGGLSATFRFVHRLSKFAQKQGNQNEGSTEARHNRVPEMAV